MMDCGFSVEIRTSFGRPLYVEPFVKLVGGAVFAPVWIGRRSYANDALIREQTKIGRYCSIGRRVTIGAQNHPLNWLSTHPFQKEKGDTGFQIQSTTIGNDVWICDNAIVRCGVKVGDGAVVAAGAVVTKDVAPYTIVGGVPAKKLGQRFDDTVIRRLLRLRWWDLSEKLIIALQYDSIDQCLDALENIKDIDRCRSVNEFISV
jgi:acetyltransferase-like isoleucine patch superfamily enzyme